MTKGKMIEILNKGFNSPLVTQDFPNIDFLKVKELRDNYGTSTTMSYNIFVLVYLFDPHGPLDVEDLVKTLHLITTALGIGGSYNRINILERSTNEDL